MVEEKCQNKENGTFEAKIFKPNRSALNGGILHQRHACSGVCRQSLVGTEPAEDGHHAAVQSS